MALPVGRRRQFTYKQPALKLYRTLSFTHYTLTLRDLRRDACMVVFALGYVFRIPRNQRGIRSYTVVNTYC